MCVVSVYVHVVCSLCVCRHVYVCLCCVLCIVCCVCGVMCVCVCVCVLYEDVFTAREERGRERSGRFVWLVMVSCPT